MRIALNQPYFIPYAGFFRLLSAVDLFVIYEDVQFPYPGYVHRNRLTDRVENTDWLTIPLKDKPLATKIKDTEFANEIARRWRLATNRFPVFQEHNELTSTVLGITHWANPVNYIVKCMEVTLDMLKIKTPVVLSSVADVRPDLKSQDRVIAICEHFRAKEYVNAPGGVSLYSKQAFLERGIDLKFFTPYENKKSILERLTYENPSAVRKEIDENSGFMDIG